MIANLLKGDSTKEGWTMRIFTVFKYICIIIFMIRIKIQFAILTCCSV